MSYRDYFMANFASPLMSVTIRRRGFIKNEWTLLDDGTLDYLVMLPDGSVHRFDREYVLDTYGDCAAGSLAQLLAKEIE